MCRPSASIRSSVPVLSLPPVPRPRVAPVRPIPPFQPFVPFARFVLFVALVPFVVFVRFVGLFVLFVPFVVPSAVLAQTAAPVGVRAEGMGGAFVAVADDATAAWWNPAGLATGALFSAILETDKGGGRAVAAALPSLGVSYFRTKTARIVRSGSTAEGASDRQDGGIAGTGLPVIDPVDALESVAVDQLGVTLGESIGDHFVVASTVKLVRAQSDTTGDLDLGAMAKWADLRLGLTVRNVRGVELGEGADRVNLARQARAGIAFVTEGRAPIDACTVAFDVDVNRVSADAGHAGRDIAGGVELWLFRRRLGLRGGAGTDVSGDAGSFVAGGASVAVAHGVFVDGAVTRRAAGDGDRWGIGLRMTF